MLVRQLLPRSVSVLVQSHMRFRAPEGFLGLRRESCNHNLPIIQLFSDSEDDRCVCVSVELAVSCGLLQ